MNVSLRLGRLPMLRATETETGQSLGETIVAAPPLLALLTAAALVDWLVTRTLTRIAIFIPKSDAMITGYQWLNWAGQVGSTLAALAAILCLAWIVREEAIARRFVWLAAAMAGLTGMGVLFLFKAPGQWLMAYYALTLFAVACIGLRGAGLSRPTTERVAVLVPALAMLAAGLHQAGPALYSTLRWPGPPPGSGAAFLAGEVLVVAAALALWLAYGRQAGMRAYFVGAVPALGFAATFLAEPAMTATIVVWSHGLTLFLPWWLYVAALWLMGATVAWQWRSGDRTVAFALVLLAAAGYAPQLSSQFHFGLIALWTLALADRADKPELRRSGT